MDIKRDFWIRPLWVAVVFLLQPLAVCWGGAWTQEEGHSYNRLAVNYFYSEKEYVDDSDRVVYENDGSFQDANLNYYLEYGVTDDLTAIASIYYKQLRREDSTIDIKTYGIGDVDLALKYKILDNIAGVFSGQVLVKVPEFYDENDTLPLGNGQYDVEFRLLYGRSVYPLFPGYFNLEAGYRWRAEDPADEFRFLVEVGSDFGANFYGRAKLDGLLGLNNGDNTMDQYGNPTIANDFDLVKLDLTLGYQLSEQWGVEAEFTPTVYGERTAYGQTYTLALVLKTF